MKWMIQKTITLHAIMFVAVAGMVSAFTGCRNVHEAGKTQWSYVTNSDNTVWLFNTEDDNTVTLNSGCWGRDVAIPNNINGLSVTSIGPSAFCTHDNLTGVLIPATVTNIEDAAFFCCSKLSSITIPGSISAIGDWAFSGCNTLTNVYFTGNAPRIGANAFNGADEVTVYHLPNTTGWSNSFCGRPTAIWNPQTNATANAKSK